MVSKGKQGKYVFEGVALIFNDHISETLPHFDDHNIRKTTPTNY